MSLENLIARLEAATEDNRRMDYEIHCAVNNASRASAAMAELWRTNKFPHYTANIDAALTLVPAGASAIASQTRSLMTFIES
jgi:hypothetical protein